MAEKSLWALITIREQGAPAKYEGVYRRKIRFNGYTVISSDEATVVSKGRGENKKIYILHEGQSAPLGPNADIQRCPRRVS